MNETLKLEVHNKKMESKGFKEKLEGLRRSL